MSIALSSDAQSVIERKIRVIQALPELGPDKFEEVFEINRCVQWIQDHSLSNVTVQFPDELLPFSARVALTLQDRLSQRVSILGDTSYGECCVDEVAAEHIGADGIIHFGNTCLTTTRRLPVLHIYTQLPFESSKLSKELLDKFQEKNIAIFYDVRYHATFQVQRDSFFQTLGSKVNVTVCEPTSECGDHVKCGRICSIDVGPDHNILYLGSNENFTHLLALTFTQCTNQFMFDPASSCTIEHSSVNVEKALMKRFYLIERARDAGRIGIVVGTLGVSRYQNIIDYVKKIIALSGKKSYTFLVGKPNVPKLANFSEIDIFVLVACPENSILDSKEFLVPIITPFELDVALNKSREWSGRFVPNFVDLLPSGSQHVPFTQETEDADVSLISGKVRATTLDANGGLASSSALATQETSVSVIHQSGGGEFLQTRSWKGLEAKLGETEVSDAVEGISGIASHYQGEGQ